MNNIAEILKDAPKGTKLYSPIFGECVLNNVGTTAIKVNTDITFDSLTFDEYGRIFPNGECLLFPSKEIRDWDNFSLKKEYKFKPFDKVVVRDNIKAKWHCHLFSYISDYNDSLPYVCLGGRKYAQCFPYNEETAKLIGTTDNYEK